MQFEQFLGKIFDTGNQVLDALSERWREHTNRRTIVIVTVAGALFGYAYLTIVQPPNDFPVDELVSVPSGESLAQVAVSLKRDRVVRSATALRALVTIMGEERTVRAGDYLFKEPKNVFSIARALSKGQFGLEPERIRIPEGATTKEMAAIYDAHLERFNEESFLAQAQPMEGYLFPDTYFFLPNATEATVIEAMRQNFDTHITTIEADIASSTRTLDEIVVMASILEREAYNTKDRKLISGVLWNRLERGMPLQVDAVFSYTIGKGTFQLTIIDLTSDSPYNTYKFKGLPPTAIGSPSLDSLLAAANPTPNDYLYFLADHRGVTHYCKTYSCQLANKRKYF